MIPYVFCYGYTASVYFATPRCCPRPAGDVTCGVVCSPSYTAEIQMLMNSKILLALKVLNKGLGPCMQTGCIKFFKILFNWRLITLQYCGGFCHTLTWISHGYTCVPHPEPPSHLPPHPIPQGHPSALALSALAHASNLDWWPISHMVIYVFQCYPLKSSHPHLLPQSPTVFSYICVSFFVSHIGSLLPSF